MSVVCQDCGGDCDAVLKALAERQQVARGRQRRLGRLDEGGVHAAVPGRRLPPPPALCLDCGGDCDTILDALERRTVVQVDRLARRIRRAVVAAFIIGLLLAASR